MEHYKDLEEKAGHFLQSRTINTPEELDAAVVELEKLKSNKKLHSMFRGVHEAKYKLYSSFQRMWFDRNLGETGTDPYLLVQNMINACLDPQHVLSKYLKQLGVVCNDWLILSFLQHYGGASPLLDFSKNFLVALYFLCKNMKLQYSDQFISHYASIYYYKGVDAAQSFRPLHRKAENVVAANLAVDKFDVWKNELSFSNVMQRPPASEPLIISVYNDASEIRTPNGEPATYFTAANINVTSQEGEFICNMDMEQPLEDVFQKDGKKYLCCLNIHKGLREYIIQKHLEGSLERNDSLYFPSEEQIAKEALERTLKNINLAKTE